MTKNLRQINSYLLSLVVSCLSFVARCARSKPAEVKHSSKRRKKEQTLFPEYRREKREEPKLVYEVHNLKLITYNLRLFI